MRGVIVAIMAVLLLSSCAANKRAQRHLHRAINLDPSIVSKYTTDTLIRLDTLILDADTIYREADSVSSTNNMDSLVKELKDGKEVVLAENDNLKVSTRLDNGNLKTTASMKPDTVYLTEEIPVIIEKVVKVPGKQITVKEKVRGFWHYSGMAAWLMIVLSAGLWLAKKLIRPI